MHHAISLFARAGKSASRSVNRRHLRSPNAGIGVFYKQDTPNGVAVMCGT